MRRLCLFLSLAWAPVAGPAAAAAATPPRPSRLCMNLPHLCTPPAEPASVSVDAAELVFRDLQQFADATDPCSAMAPAAGSAADLTAKLQAQYVGHEGAVRHLTAQITKRADNFRSSLKPIVVLIMGPSGTGKTHLGRQLARALDTELIEVNLNAYTEANSISGLRGTSAGYKGFGENTALTRLLEKPDAVVLLDEVEKAHQDVHKFFYNVFDSGDFTMANHTPVKCNKATFILTSNVGGAYISEDALCPGKLSSCGIDPRAKTMLRDHFDGDAFLNRIEAFYAFAHFKEDEVHQIGDQILRQVRQRFCHSHGFLLGWVPDLPRLILQSSTFRRLDGIRALERTLLNGVEDLLWGQHRRLARGSKVVLSWNTSVAALDLRFQDPSGTWTAGTDPSASATAVHPSNRAPGAAVANREDGWSPAPWGEPESQAVPQQAVSPWSDRAVEVGVAVATWAIGSLIAYAVLPLALPLYVARAVALTVSVALAVSCYYLAHVIQLLYKLAWLVASVLWRLGAWLWRVIPDHWKPYLLWLLFLFVLLRAVFRLPGWLTRPKRMPAIQKTPARIPTREQGCQTECLSCTIATQTTTTATT